MNIATDEFVQKIVQTREVIEKMMTEPVRHMLDSGGIYGRAYQKRIDRNFTEAESATLKWDEWGVEVQASLYHHLCRTLLFNEEKQHEFDDMYKSKDTSWEEDLKDWVASNKYDVTYVFNSNDYDYTILDGVFYAWVVEDENGNEFVVVRTHNGCDLNAGYSAPYMFYKRAYKLMAASGDDCDLFAIQNVDVVCVDNIEHAWYFDLGHFWSNIDGAKLEFKWNGEFFPCPNCGGKLVADM